MPIMNAPINPAERGVPNPLPLAPMADALRAMRRRQTTVTTPAASTTEEIASVAANSNDMAWTLGPECAKRNGKNPARDSIGAATEDAVPATSRSAPSHFKGHTTTVELCTESPPRPCHTKRKSPLSQGFSWR